MKVFPRKIILSLLVCASIFIGVTPNVKASVLDTNFNSLLSESYIDKLSKTQLDDILIKKDVRITITTIMEIIMNRQLFKHKK